MRDLKDIRENIDEVDKEIIALLERRMELAMYVADYKKGTGKAIYDRERELAKLEKIKGYTETDFNKCAMEEIFLQIMSISRRYQYSLIGDNDNYIDSLYTNIDKLPIYDNTKVVYQGVPGAFAEEAMYKFFGANISNYNVDTFENVMIELDKGNAKYGVLPIENSTAGFVSGIYDLLGRYDLTLVGEQIIKINQALLGVKGATLSDIKTVCSHPQGLLQSKIFVKNHNLDQIEVANTALSAKMVVEKQDKTLGAICSIKNAELYGLDIIEPRVNENSDNSTRFVIISKKKIYTKAARKVGITFSLPHESGSLYNILAHFIFNNLNMTSIESVPMGNKTWEYRFFVSFEGNLAQTEVRNAIKGIKEEVGDFKILGNY